MFENVSPLTATYYDSVSGLVCITEAYFFKVYGSEGVWNGVNEALQVLGGKRTS